MSVRCPHCGEPFDAIWFTHPVREAMLPLFVRERSAKDLADELGVALGTAAYHVRMLREAGVLRRTRRVPRRGATQTFYVLAVVS